MQINLIHQEMSEKQCYQNIKEMHKAYPDIIMNPKQWKKLRAKELD